VDKEQVYINTTGNQALATAGSGDVLTGIISSLVAQSYSPLHAALLGVYLHGLTADLAVKNTSYAAFIASDIIAHLGVAFLALEDMKKESLE
jgi:NAD(P)H-hydrate repair Nnr-like enzyme with NAD(P)H-hydrate dehydratase domain